MSNLTAEIISVGTELLMGQILDTNAQYISQRLAEVGINQYYRTTVGDNRVRLQHTIQQALDRADLVILTRRVGANGGRPYKGNCGGSIGLYGVFHR